MNEHVHPVNDHTDPTPPAPTAEGRDPALEGTPAESAYECFQEGSRLLASASAHAAAVVLERARDLEPDQGSIREALGRAYFRTGRYSDAKAEFARVVEIDPVNDYALFGLGLCLLKEGDRAAAEAGGGDASRPARLPGGARARSARVTDVVTAGGRR